MCVLVSAKTFIVAALENVLKYVLGCAIISSWNAFTTYLIECLDLSIDVSVNAGIALFAEKSTHLNGIGNTEGVRQIKPIFFAVVFRSHILAELSNDFQHSAFTGADVAVEP